MQIKLPTSLLLIASLSLGLCACSDMGGHVANDPGGASVGGGPGGGSGAVPNDMGTHASGSMNGGAAANGDPVTNTGNLGSGSTTGDPMSGSNAMGPAVRY